MNLLPLTEFAQSFEGLTDPEAFFLHTLAASMWLIALVALLSLTERVLFALAAYYDAKAKSNPDALMWALLIGFLGFIPAIIYLVVRNSGKAYVTCPSCGLSHMSSDFACPRCGAPTPAPNPNANPFAAEQAHRAKVLMIVGFIVLAVTLVLSIIFTTSIVNAAITLAESGYYY